MSLRDAVKSVTSNVKSKIGDLGFTLQGENFAIEVGKAAKDATKAEAKARRLSQRERKALEAEAKEELAREYAAAALARDQAASERVRQAPAGQAFRALQGGPKAGGGANSLLLPAAILGAAFLLGRG